MDAFWYRLVPPTGTKGPPAWARSTGHVEAHLSRFGLEPGLKGGGISHDPLVPVQEPGLKAVHVDAAWSSTFSPGWCYQPGLKEIL